MASKTACPRCKYACGSTWNYCPRCSYELVENPHPVKKADDRKKITMNIAKLWVVRFENGPWGMGMNRRVEDALRESAIQPVDYMTHHIILLPPMRDEMLTPVPLDIIQRAVEEGGDLRVERYWPYGMGGK
jgi:hypothetical protein